METVGWGVDSESISLSNLQMKFTRSRGVEAMKVHNVELVQELPVLIN